MDVIIMSNIIPYNIFEDFIRNISRISFEDTTFPFDPSMISY